MLDCCNERGCFKPKVKELVWFPEQGIRALVPVCLRWSGPQCCSQCWSLQVPHPEHKHTWIRSFSIKGPGCQLLYQLLDCESDKKKVAEAFLLRYI